MKETWNIIKGTLQTRKTNHFPDVFHSKDGHEFTDGNKIAKAFNNCFVGLGPSLASSIDFNVHFSSNLRDSNPSTIFLFPVTESEAFKVPNSIFTTMKSAGFDNFRPYGKPF